jgi:hypothetical protein
MQAHKWHNIVAILPTHIEESLVALAIYSWQNNALHPFGTSSLDNLSAVIIESLIVDM